MFNKRAKARPSLRAREADDDGPSTGSPLAKSVITAEAEDAGDSSMATEDDGLSVMERKKLRNKEKKTTKPASRLSFGGEGEESQGTPFKQKKSLLSQSLKLPSTPTASSNPSQPAASSSSSVYSREYLSQLKAATPNRSARTDEAQSDDEEDDVGGKDNQSGGLSRAAREKFGNVLVEDTTAGIPDAAVVAAARMKRQAALTGQKRGMGDDDYIALGGGQVAVWDGEKGPHPESRLMREEDEGDEGDEDMAEYTEANEKMFLGKKANKSAARRLKGEIGEMIADREMEDDDDEEAREWEEAQARRGGTWEQEKAVVPKPTQMSTSAPIPIARPLPSISAGAARVAKELANIKGSQVESQHNLEIAVRDLSILEEQEKDLRKEVERVEGKKEWVEGFRGWVEMLGGFLEEKVPKLDDIEADAMHHLKERADMVAKRRSGDDEDDLALVVGTPLPIEQGVDGLNADSGPSSAVRRVRRSERESRRAKRKSRQAKVSETDEGYSTDSSLAEGDALDYAAATRDLGKRVNRLLEDVRAEDFRDPEKGVAVKFGDWRKRYEEEYVSAFGGLAMVQAWEFYARSEMVGWEPLRSSTSLESFSWFHALHTYSHPRPEQPLSDDEMEVDEFPLGPDGDLVVEMTQKTVLPILIKSCENGAYDPYSTPQTRRAIDLAEVIHSLCGESSRKYADLLRAIMAVFGEEIARQTEQVASCLRADAIAPPAFHPATRTALGRYVRRRLKLVRNLLMWKREAGREVGEMVSRIVGEVLRPVLQRHWEGGGKELAQTVAMTVGNVVRPDLAVFLREGPGRRAW